MIRVRVRVRIRDKSRVWDSRPVLGRVSRPWSGSGLGFGTKVGAMFQDRRSGLGFDTRSGLRFGIKVGVGFRYRNLVWFWDRGQVRFET